MITILFDIDGTLIRTGGAGMIAIEQTMKEMFGLPKVGMVKVHGRTDQGILSDLFEQASLSFNEHRDEFSNLYWQYLPVALHETPGGEILPGVIGLLELLQLLQAQQKVALGILTGNSKRAAEIKLEHFGLAKYFHFGGYGDIHANRNDVAASAYEAAKSYLGDQFDSNKLWVVGDTVNDVTCARSIGSRVIAVETGGGSNLELANSNPDQQMQTLLEVEAFLSAIEQPVAP